MSFRNDDDTTDESSLISTNSEFDREYETELLELNFDAFHNRRRDKRSDKRSDKHKYWKLRYKLNIFVFKKEITISIVSDDSNDSTDSENDTNDKMSLKNENDEYFNDVKFLIACLKNHWQRLIHFVTQLHTSWLTKLITDIAKRTMKLSADFKWHNLIDALRVIEWKDLYKFFNWRFKLKCDKKDCRLKETRKLSFLKDNWKNFFHYYKSVTDIKLNSQLMRLMREICSIHCVQIDEINNHERIFNNWSRSTSWTRRRRRHWCMLKTCRYFKKSLFERRKRNIRLKFQQMQLCLYNLLNLFTLNRKSAILALRFKNLRVSLQRDSSDEFYISMMKFNYSFTKKNFDFTQTYALSDLSILKHAYIYWSTVRNTFILSEIIYESSLILSSHTFLFDILFFFDDFKIIHLISMKKLR